MCEDCFQKPIRNEMWKAEMFGKRILRNNLLTLKLDILLSARKILLNFQHGYFNTRGKPHELCSTSKCGNRYRQVDPSFLPPPIEKSKFFKG